MNRRSMTTPVGLCLAAALLAPFSTLDEVTAAVPRILDSGIGPMILEYIDLMTMAAMTAAEDLGLGIPDSIRESALAYLVVVLESAHDERLDADVEALGTHLADLGAVDVYVLPPAAATRIIEAREKAFYLAKANGAQDIVDVVVPRAAIPKFMAETDRNDADIISGTRYPNGFDVDIPVPADRREINRTITATLNERLDLRLTDSFCGFKAYRVSALRHLCITVPGYAMPMQFWVQAAAAGLRVRELPVELIYNDPSRHFGGFLDDPAARFEHYVEVFEAELARFAKPIGQHGAPQAESIVSG